MSAARVEQVHADRVSAREFLAHAEQFLEDARTPTITAPSRAVLLHNAAISACDSILQAVGLRISSGDRSHTLRLETALHQLDLDTEDLLDRLDASRARRNEASYAAGFIAQTSILDADKATAELLELARRFVGAG
jgi:hypothetical protein